MIWHSNLASKIWKKAFSIFRKRIVYWTRRNCNYFYFFYSQM